MSEEFEKKVINLLESMNEKLDTLLGSDQSSAPIEPKEAPASVEPKEAPASIESEESSVKIESTTTRKPSEVAKLQEEKAKEEDETLVKTEGRRIYPPC